jgi:hypothetical protein
MGLGKTYSTRYLADSNNSTGAAGQVLISTATGVDWSDGSDIIGGPYLPLAGGTLSGNLTMDDSDILFKHSDGSNYYRLGIGASANFEIYNTNYGRTDLLITQSTGNVGIGVTNPGAPLEIAAESTNVGNTLLNIGNAILNPNTRDSWIKMFGSQATVDKTFAVGNMYGKFVVNYLGTRATNPESGGTKMFTIDGSNGNVGIGVTAPVAKLDVSTSGNTAIPALASVPGASTSAVFGNTGNTVILAVGVDNANTSWLQGRQTTGTGSAFDIALNPLGGNVGIGTTSPGVKLTVSKAGNGNIAGFTNTTDADLNINLTSGVTMLTPSTALLAFGTSSSEKMRIIGNGNVGIGTTTPDTKLMVSGEILSENSNGGYFVSTRVPSSSSRPTLNFYGTALDINYVTSYAGTGADTAVSILTNGNVGIGATGPTSKLQVNYSAAPSFAANGGANALTLIRDDSGGDLNEVGAGWFSFLYSTIWIWKYG